MLQVKGRKMKEATKNRSFKQSWVFDLAIYSRPYRKIIKPAKKAEIRHRAIASISQIKIMKSTTGIPITSLNSPQATQLHPVLTTILFSQR